MNTTKKSTTAKKASTQGRTRRNASKTKKTATQSSGTSSDGMQQSEEQMPLLEKMFYNMLKDTYWAEKHLVEALTTMQQEATTEELQEAFEDHRFQTEKHISRLEKVFRLLGQAPEAKKCAAMEGLTNEAKEIMEETKENTMTRDAALIIAAQKVEHYEIATYGSLVQIALTLGYDQAADLLEKTLWEEEDTDTLLTEIAEMYVNPLADEEPAEVTMEMEEV